MVSSLPRSSDETVTPMQNVEDEDVEAGPVLKSSLSHHIILHGIAVEISYRYSRS